jgi:hypothetical protein
MSIKVKTNIIKTGKYRFIKDATFAIKPTAGEDEVPEFQTNSNNLYIVKDYIIDANSALSNLIAGEFIIKKNSDIELTMKLPGGLDIVKKYDEYEFHRPLKDEREYHKNGEVIDDDVSLNENDCLKFGECLTVANKTNEMTLFNEKLKAQYSPYVLESKTNEMPFGATVKDADNIKILKTIPDNEKNNYAVPNNGESYAIVRKKLIKKRAPYHISFVLYTHEGVNITLEAEADNRNNYQPKFCFYDINSDGYTFHRRWSAELYKNATDPPGIDRYNTLYNNGETIVLKSRSIDDILKEVDEENAKNMPDAPIKEIVTKDKIEPLEENQEIKRITRSSIKAGSKKYKKKRVFKYKKTRKTKRSRKSKK